MKTRTNSDIIHAYADGFDVQYLSGDLKWIDYDPLQPSAPHLGSVLFKWRIKPATIEYRVGLCKLGDSYWTTTVHNEEDANKIEHSTLDRWLTDWVEVEIES